MHCVQFVGLSFFRNAAQEQELQTILQCLEIVVHTHILKELMYEGALLQSVHTLILGTL